MAYIQTATFITHSKVNDLKQACVVLDSVNTVYLVMNAMGWLP